MTHPLGVTSSTLDIIEQAAQSRQPCARMAITDVYAGLTLINSTDT